MLEQIKNHKFKFGFWHYQILGWTVYLLNNTGYIWIEITSTGDSPFLIADFYIIFFLCTLALRYIFRAIYKPSTPFYIYFIVSLLASLVVSVFLAESRILDNYLFGNYPPWSKVPRDFTYLIHIISDSWPVFVWSILYFSIRYWQDFTKDRERLATAELMAAQAQLKMLRYQINPHFLFNSLNSIKALTYENPEKAGAMLTEFSDFLRATLNYNDKIFIPVKEEIEILQKYFLIEKIRFEERLEYSIKYDYRILKKEILCFITQPLVENSIKHGLTNNPEGIKLNIDFSINHENMEIRIENTGKLNKENITNGTGINNVTARLRNVYSNQFKLDLFEENDMVKVKLIIPISK